MKQIKRLPYEKSVPASEIRTKNIDNLSSLKEKMCVE